jgi:hypothetical protein
MRSFTFIPVVVPILTDGLTLPPQLRIHTKRSASSKMTKRPSLQTKLGGRKDLIDAAFQTLRNSFLPHLTAYKFPSVLPKYTVSPASAGEDRIVPIVNSLCTASTMSS